jgi:cob(I)alamin adenosyltransferase
MSSNPSIRSTERHVLAASKSGNGKEQSLRKNNKLDEVFHFVIARLLNIE